MNDDIKTRWLAALRSGDYTQGKVRLRARSAETGKERYCCLGVLCEIAVADGVIEKPEYKDNGVLDEWQRIQDAAGHYVYGAGHDRSSQHLPLAVSRWAGLHGGGGPSVSGGGLVGINDGGATFEQIADMIEADL